MSTAKKASAIPTVTDMTGRTVVVAEGDALKRISYKDMTKDYMEFNVDSAQWIRVAQFSSNASCIMAISNVWINTSGGCTLLHVLLHPNDDSYNSVNTLSRLKNTSASTLVPKIRVVRKKGALCYIDMYYNLNIENHVRVQICSGIGISLLTPKIMQKYPKGIGTIEFVLSSAQVLSGGV